MAQNYAKNGDEVIVVTAGRNREIEVTQENGYTLYRLPTVFRLPRLGFFMNFEQFYLINSRANRKRLVEIFRKHRIEAVHTSNHLLDAIFLSQHASSKLGIPNICTVQGVIAHGGVKVYDWVMKSIDWAIIRRTMNRFDAIVSLDKANQDYVDSMYQTQRSILIPLCGFDNEALRAIPAKDWTRPDRGDGVFRIASIGHVTENRHRCELVRALPALIRAGYNPKLEIIGKVLTDQAVQLAEELGVQNHVQFHGELERSKAFEVLREVDIEAHLFFMPGLGLATLEAMALGLPTVAYGYEGLYGSVPLKHMGNIAFANPYDQESVNRALLDLAGNPEKRRQIGLAARALIEKHLVWESIVGQYKDLFAELVRESRATQTNGNTRALSAGPGPGAAAATINEPRL